MGIYFDQVTLCNHQILVYQRWQLGQRSQLQRVDPKGRSKFFPGLPMALASSPALITKARSNKVPKSVETQDYYKFK